MFVSQCVSQSLIFFGQLQSDRLGSCLSAQSKSDIYFIHDAWKKLPKSGILLRSSAKQILHPCRSLYTVCSVCALHIHPTCGSL